MGSTVGAEVVVGDDGGMDIVAGVGLGLGVGWAMAIGVAVRGDGAVGPGVDVSSMQAHKPALFA